MTGELVCRTSPEVNATVYYNGTKLTNPTPVRLIKLPPGVKTIKYELAGYESSTDRVEVFDDTTSYSTITLKTIAPPIEEKGKIRCITTPDGADIYFNGKKQPDPTNVTLTGITPNKFHTIKFTKTGFEDISDQWTVAPGKTIVAEKILIPTVANTVLTLNTLPKTVTEGNKLTLSGKLLTTDGRPVVGKISLMDVFFVDELLTTTTTSPTGAFLVTWIIKKVNSPPYASRIDIAAKYTGIDPYKSSESAKQTLVIETKVEKGFIDVSSQPPNADVFMDGKKMLGETPMHLSPDEIGKHTIKIAFGEFEPYVEVVEVEAGKTAEVRHTFIAPSNFCSILGFDVTAEECSKGLLTLGIDLLTPIADAHIILNHTSPYTGKPEEPTNWTYFFFLLGMIPIAGTVTKAVSKTGLKLTAEGAKLAKLAKADQKLAEVLMEGRALSKLPHMSDIETSTFWGHVTHKDYFKLRALLDTTSTTTKMAYENWRDEFVENVGKIMDPKATGDVVKYMDDAVKISEKTYPALKTFDLDTTISNTLFEITTESLVNKQLQEILIDKKFINKIIVASPEEASTLLNFIKLNKLDEFTSMLEKMDDAPLNDITKSEIANEILKIIDPSGIHVDATKIIRQSIGLPYGRGEFWQTFFLTRYLREEEDLAQYMDGVVREVFDVARTNTNIVSEFVRVIINSNEIDPLIQKLALSNIKEAKIFSQYLKSMKVIVQSESKLGTHFDDVITKLSDGFYKGVYTDNAYPITNVLEGLFDAHGNLKNVDEIVQFLTKAVPDLFTKFSDMLADITSGAKKSITKTEADEFLQMSTDFPDITGDILRSVDSNAIVKNLDNIKTDESSAISTFIKSTDKIDTRSEDFTKIASQSSAAIKAALNDAPQTLPKMSKTTDDINNIFTNYATIEKSAGAAGVKVDYNIIEAIEDAWKSIKNSPLQTPSITANFIKGYMKGIWKFMKAHPAYAIVTAIGVTIMSLWFNSDNVPFYGYMWLDHKGLKPGTRSFIANQQLDRLKTQAFLSKDFCGMADYESLETALDLYKAQLNTLETYINENRDTLKSEGFLDLAEDGLESYTLMLKTDEMLKCLPAEIPIPESGLITDVTVKEIIDGDTIKCLKNDETFNVRMAGYNTPEKKPAILDFYPVTCTESVGSTPHTIECTKDMYREANGFFWKLIESKTVSLKINPERPKDAYGRYIAVVILENGSEANLEMIKAGHACFYHEEYFGEPKIYDPSTYISARNEAKAASLGIWASEELEGDVGSVIFKAFRLTEEDKPTGLTAEIWLSDDFLYNSSTTKERDWPVGTHEIIFKAMGYVDKPAKFTIEKNKSIVVDATMSSAAAIADEGYAILRTYRMSTTGSLVAITSDIYEDDTYLFRTSASTLRAFSPGKHTVVFKNINYEDKSSTFTIETDKTITVNETLVELPEDETEDPAEPDEPFGLVDFMSTPSVAKIFVNGSYIGTTKKSGFKLAEGSYSVMFEKEGYEPCTKPLTVIANERFPVECILLESLLPPTEGEYPDVPYFPSTPSYKRSPPISYEITPTISAPPPTEPKAEPWEEFETPIKVLFLNIGKEVAKQTTITTAGQKFIDKHCDLEFEWESEDHDMVELGMDDDDCAILDDIEELSETIEQDTIPDGTKIIYLLWNADEPKCVSYTGYTGDTIDLLFDAMLCSSPTSKSKPEFAATTGKLKNDNLEIVYEGSLTIIIQICEALHELYEKTKSDDAPELPEFDEEFCKKNITKDRPNAKCVVEWLSKFNDALPDEVKK